MTNKIIVLSYATYKCQAYYNFIYAVNKNKYEYTITGVGTKWGGFINRLKYYKDVVDTYSDDTIFCIVDCYDVLCCDNASIFDSKLQLFDIDNKIIFSTETHCGGNCTPVAEWWKQQQPLCNVPNKYINAGMYVGKKKNLLPMFNYTIKPENTDDQIVFGRYINEHTHNIELDFKCELFGTLITANQKHYTFKNNKVYNKLYNTNPCFMHFPGNDYYCNFKLLSYSFLLYGPRHATVLFKNRNDSYIILLVVLILLYKQPKLVILLAALVLLWCFYIVY